MRRLCIVVMLTAVMCGAVCHARAGVYPMFWGGDSGSVSYVDDSPYSSGWDADVTHSPSRNALYDILQNKQDFDTAINSLSSKVWAATALTGTGGVDTIAYASIAGGDIVFVGTTTAVWYVYIFDSSSTGTESFPDIIAPDDVGANAGRWLLRLQCETGSCTVPQSTAGAANTLPEGSAYGTNYRRASVPDSLSSDLDLRHADAVPSKRQLQIYPTPTGTVSQYTWADYGYLPSYNADQLSDTTSPHALTAVDVNGTQINNYAATAEAKEFDLPAAAAGYNVMFILGAAQNVTINPQDSDIIYLQTPDHSLSALAAGEAVVNLSPTLGESIVCVTFQTASSTYAWKCVSDSDDFNEETP